MKKILLIIACIIISCNTDKQTSKQLKTEVKKEVTLEAPREEIKYITAKSGLIYRDAPNGKSLGKFDFKSKVSIIEHTNTFQKITDGNKTIEGEWVGVKSNNNKIVYVFNGFLSNIKQAPPTISFSEAKKYLYNGIWVSKEFKSILEKTKLYSKASYYRDSPHNIIFYDENKVSCWSENEMEERYLTIDENLNISGIQGTIININNYNLTITIKNENFHYFKIDRPFTPQDSVFNIIDRGSNQVIKNWFAGDYILFADSKETNVTFTPNTQDDFLFAWYENYDNNVLVDIINIYGNSYKINKIENNTYFLEEMEPIDDFSDPEAVSTGKKATLTKVVK